MVSAEYNLNFIEVLFLTYIVRSYEHDRNTWRHAKALLSQYNRIGGLRLSSSSQWVSSITRRRPTPHLVQSPATVRQLSDLSY
jgi:hypothetical protein